MSLPIKFDDTLRWGDSHTALEKRLVDIVRDIELLSDEYSQSANVTLLEITKHTPEYLAGLARTRYSRADFEHWKALLALRWAIRQYQFSLAKE